MQSHLSRNDVAPVFSLILQVKNSLEGKNKPREKNEEEEGKEKKEGGADVQTLRRKCPCGRPRLVEAKFRAWKEKKPRGKKEREGES